MTEHNDQGGAEILEDLGTAEHHDLADGEVVTQPVTAESLGLDLPSDPAAAVDMLLGEIKQARDDAGDYLDRWQRAAADLDNYRKRALREQAQLRNVASERVVSSLLPVLDSFSAALDLPAETEGEQRLLAGMRGTHAQLMDVLAREGFEAIPAVGEPFDPEVHEAVSAPSDGSGTLEVIHELRRGYRLGGRVLRPALVAVGYGEGE